MVISMGVVYQGIMFPFSVGANSFPATAINQDLLKQSILQILLTTPGERVFLPTFGSALESTVFENTGAALTLKVRSIVLSSLTRWEPRIVVQSINVSEQESSVYITITYAIPSLQQQDTMTMQLNKA
jgi:uncharacterized protein